MGSYRVSATGRVNAPAPAVYRLIADYHIGHPRIVPPEYFSNIVVEAGGYGAGTRISFDARMLGITQRARAVIEEPEPGRVLLERLEVGWVTTFTVDPAGAAACDVTIATEVPPKGGITGWFERIVAARVLPKIYRAELARIGEVARG
jgi:hypothetical protein